jgi:hypothetical protein
MGRSRPALISGFQIHGAPRGRSFGRGADAQAPNRLASLNRVKKALAQARSLRPISRRVLPGTRRAYFWTYGKRPAAGISWAGNRELPMDDKTRTELEAAVYRRLVEHLRTRTDVQNIDMMNLAGFCRNCLSNWMKDAADAKGVPMTKEQSREIVYGMPYKEWQARYQTEASDEARAKFAHKV